MSGLNFQQSQKQSQSLSIAPQLQNSLKILQSASFDLRTAILSELQKESTPRRTAHRFGQR